jgi:predicted Rossmann fold flavoprotein
VEKNQSLGRKLAMTGKGRCNLTNACTDEELHRNIISGDKFMYSAFSRFSPRDTMYLFENRFSVPLKTERGNRVFPVSDKASDIVKALTEALNANGVKIVCGDVREILSEEDRVTGVRLADGREIEAENVVVATGGISYPKTGSTGDGYRFARAFGHRVNKPQGCLVPLETAEDCSMMMGLSLKNVTLSLYKDGKLIWWELGELLFTHFGISGPLVLKASAFVKHEEAAGYSVKINCKPGLDEKKLDARLLRDFREGQNRNLSNIFKSLLPLAMIEPVLKKAGIEADRKANTVTKEERARLCSVIQGFELHIKKVRPDSEAIVTAGGVSLDYLESRTFMSRHIRGLYFIGECIDVHGFTGGFNLQIAFSTANAAAESIAGF